MLGHKAKENLQLGLRVVTHPCSDVGFAMFAGHSEGMSSLSISLSWDE